MAAKQASGPGFAPGTHGKRAITHLCPQVLVYPLSCPPKRSPLPGPWKSPLFHFTTMHPVFLNPCWAPQPTCFPSSHVTWEVQYETRIKASQGKTENLISMSFLTQRDLLICF
ncbi:rCG42992 [Rattus norvegicus]|uniref:RCG42992 n=1 Tax=Rattus norvegicus TaxID=10116 RepID=A6IW63_RAT|nr:rCG42992 [Rattus norvegicus]